jgi:hypothetical protein
VLLFANELEKHYFDSWYKLTEQLGGGFFEDSFWSRTIPQLSRENLAIRYAAIAIGAVSSSTAPNLASKQTTDLGANGVHYNKALSYYGQAIRQMRQLVRVNESSLRAAIVCCILFICFEALLGDRKAALSLMINGQRMMDEMLKCSRDGSLSGIGTEAIEAETLQVFQRLTLQGWSCGVLKPRPQTEESPSWCCRGGPSNQFAIQKMPDAFDTLSEARRWWDVTQHYVMHSSSIVIRFNHLGLTPNFITDCRSRSNRDDSTGQSLDGSGHPASDRHEHLRQSLKQWHDRFQPLFDTAKQNERENKRAYLQAISLRIFYLTLYTCVQCPIRCDYETMESMTPYFQEIVRLSSIILPNQPKFGQSLETFTMDNGPSWPLFVTAARCRDAIVREEAMTLLNDYPRRDGLWDSRIFHLIGVQNRERELAKSSRGTLADRWWQLQHQAALVDRDGRRTDSTLLSSSDSGKSTAQSLSLTGVYDQRI